MRLAEILGIEDSPVEIPTRYKIFKYDRILSSTDAKIRNATIIKCPICGIKSNEPNMRRWHFEQCTQPLISCQKCGKPIPRQGTKPFLYKHKKFCDRVCYAHSKNGIAPIIMTESIRDKIRLSVIGKKHNLEQNIAQSDRMMGKKRGPYKKHV